MPACISSLNLLINSPCYYTYCPSSVRVENPISNGIVTTARGQQHKLGAYLTKRDQFGLSRPSAHLEPLLDARHIAPRPVSAAAPCRCRAPPETCQEGCQQADHSPAFQTPLRPWTGREGAQYRSLRIGSERRRKHAVQIEGDSRQRTRGARLTLRRQP